MVTTVDSGNLELDPAVTSIRYDLVEVGRGCDEGIEVAVVGMLVLLASDVMRYVLALCVDIAAVVVTVTVVIAAVDVVVVVVIIVVVVGAAVVVGDGMVVQNSSKNTIRTTQGQLHVTILMFKVHFPQQ